MKKMLNKIKVATLNIDNLTNISLCVFIFLMRRPFYEYINNTSWYLSLIIFLGLYFITKYIKKLLKAFIKKEYINLKNFNKKENNKKEDNKKEEIKKEDIENPNMDGFTCIPIECPKKLILNNPNVVPNTKILLDDLQKAKCNYYIVLMLHRKDFSEKGILEKKKSLENYIVVINKILLLFDNKNSK